MEEIGYLLYGSEGEASYVYISGGAKKVPIGRVIMGDDNSENAYVDLLMTDYDDDSAKPQYHSYGYITPYGLIYKKFYSGKEPELIGYTARPSSPDIPTTKGERTWKTLWLKCTLNVYLGLPKVELEGSDDNAYSHSTPITGINSISETDDTAIGGSENGLSENHEVPDSKEIHIEENETELPLENDAVELKEDSSDETDMSKGEEVKEIAEPTLSDSEKAELDKIKKIYPELIKSLLRNMVYVKGGTFAMGANTDEHSFSKTDKSYTIENNESPKHEVTLSDFYIGRYPVTQAEWKAIMGYNLSESRNNRFPVAPVNWDECQLFVKRLSYIVGVKFSLPTEAQWEFAARGGVRSKGYVFSGSNVFSNVGHRDYKNPVGTKQSNELGIYDMSGLVREWCNDIWGKYSEEPQIDPQGPSDDLVVKDDLGGYMRVVRSPAGNETVTNRKGESPRLDKNFKSYGFRLACDHLPDEVVEKDEDDVNEKDNANVVYSPKPSAKNNTTSMLVGISSHFSFHSSKHDAMSPESRACAYSLFYSLYNKVNYTEYYKDKPYGWRDTALLSSFIYSVLFICWYLFVKFILNERFIGYHFWKVPGVTFLYYPLWYVVRLIKIDRMENSLSVQSKIDMFNRSLRQASFDKAIIICSIITALFTLSFYRFDFLPLVFVMLFGVITNMTLKSNKQRWHIQGSNDDIMTEDSDVNEDVKNPEGDIPKHYNWELEKNYTDPNVLQGNLTLYFTDKFVKEMRYSNPFYIQRKDKNAKDYILEMFHTMKEHNYLTGRIRYIVNYINRLNIGIDEIDPLTKIQFTLDFVQEPNIVYALNEECEEIDMFPDYIRWPEETLYDQKADCNSKALLAAMLFHFQERNVLYMFSRQHQHAAVGVEFDSRWIDKDINDKKAIDCTIKYKGKTYLFCEVTMDGIAIGGLLEGMSYEDFDDCVELPLFEPDIDDDDLITIYSDRMYNWRLDSVLGNPLHGTITLKFKDDEIKQLRALNPFCQFGIDGYTYEQNITRMFNYLNKNPEHRSKVKAIADYIKDTIKQENLPEIDLVQFTLDFAQAPNITYCVDEQSKGINFAKEYMRFPDEVLFDKEGDCDCKSALTAALFHELGYNVIIMLSSKLGHAAIGIECKEEWLCCLNTVDLSNVVREHNGKNYLYCETTGDGFRIGHIDENSSIQDFEAIVEIKV